MAPVRALQHPHPRSQGEEWAFGKSRSYQDSASFCCLMLCSLRIPYFHPWGVNLKSSLLLPFLLWNSTTCLYISCVIEYIGYSYVHIRKVTLTSQKKGWLGIETWCSPVGIRMTFTMRITSPWVGLVTPVYRLYLDGNLLKLVFHCLTFFIIW